MRNKEEILKSIQDEYYIWIIYLIIIGISFWANGQEEKYFLEGNLEAKDNYRKAIILIFSITLIIYYYFFISSYNTYKNLKAYDTENKKTFESLNLIATTLILIAGIIFLFIAISNEEIETELAF